MGTESLHHRLIKLGDMMGDGLHHEDGSITREYRKVARALYPEMFSKKKRKPSQKFIKSLTPCQCGAKSLKLKTTYEGILIFCPDCLLNENAKYHKSRGLARDQWNRICV